MLIGKLTLNDNHVLNLKGFDRGGTLRLDCFTHNNADYALFVLLNNEKMLVKAMDKGLDSVIPYVSTHNNEDMGFNIRKKSRSAQYIGNKNGLFHTLVYGIKVGCYASTNRDFLVHKDKNSGTYQIVLEGEDLNFVKGVCIDKLEFTITTVKTDIIEFDMVMVSGDLTYRVYFYEDKDYSEYLKPLKYRTVQIGNPFEEEKMSKQTLDEITKIGLDNVRGLLIDLDELLVKKNMGYIKEKKYLPLDNTKDFYEYLEYLSVTDRLIKADFETTGLKITSNSRNREDDRMVGLAIAVNELEGTECELDEKFLNVKYYIPVYHTEMSNLFTNLNDNERAVVLSDLEFFHYPKEKISEIRECVENGQEDLVNDWIMMGYLQPVFEKKRLGNANVSFDWKVGYIYYMNMNFVEDSQLAAQLLIHEYPDYDLKALTYQIVGRSVLELDDFSPTGKWEDLPFTFRDLPSDYVLAYAPADVDNLDRIFEVLQKKIEKTEQETVYQLEVAFARAIGYQEFWGYNMKPHKVEKLNEELMGELHEVTSTIYGLAGEEFNLDSPAQLLKVMNDRGYDIKSTKKEALKQLYKDEFVGAILRYRGISQIIKLFVKPLPDQMNENGDIYPSSFSIGARTGRTSASKPNYQQADDTIKRYVEAREGFYLVDSDLSQIEYRVTGSLSRQPELLEMFKDFEKDYHTYQTSRMFKIPYELVERSQRNQAKGINFGLPYGMGDSTLGYSIFGKRNEETKKKAAHLRKIYFEGQEKVLEFFENSRDMAVANGYSRTWFGRRRYYDFVRYSVNQIRKQAGNAVIQGTSADIFKLNMVRLFHYIKKNDLWDKVRILAFIHDEVLLEVHESINPYFIQKILRECMEYEYSGFCPIYCGVGFGHTWYEAKEDLSEINTQAGHQLYAKADTVNWKDSAYYQEGDIVALMGKELQDYKKRYMISYINNTENHNKPIRPFAYAMLNEFVHGIRVDTDRLPDRAFMTKPSLKLRTTLTLDIRDSGNATLKELLSSFITLYMSDEVSVDAINLIDPKDATAKSIASTETKEVSTEVLEEEYKKIELNDFLDISGYYFEPDTLTLNLGCLVLDDVKKVRTYLDIKEDKDADYTVKLVFKDGDTISEIKTYSIAFRDAESVVRFVRRANTKPMLGAIAY